MECRWRLYTALLFMAILSVLVACTEDIPTPTPIPTATPTPIPTVTPTPIPTPTPTPIATATPTPPYAAVWNNLEHTQSLERDDPASASAIKSLSWVADGIDDAERENVQQLAYLAAMRPSVFDALIEQSWVADGVDDAEREVLGNVRAVADSDEDAALKLLALPFLDAIDSADGPTTDSLASFVTSDPSSVMLVFNALVEKSWVADGLDEVEIGIVGNIRVIADNDGSAALRLLALPFLDAIDPADVPTVESLGSFVTSSPSNALPVFNALMEKSWVVDGLDKVEIRIVGNIHMIADEDEDATLRVLALPFLETVETDDNLTVSSLLRFVAYRQDYSLQVFDALTVKPWVADGLDEAERVIVGNIRWIAESDESAALNFIGAPFLETVEPEDSVTIETLLTFRQDYGQQLSIDPIKALIEKPWVADGLDEAEQEMIGNIRWIADNSKSAALQVLALPFLDAVGPGDGSTIESLAHLAAAREGNNLPVFNALIAKSWVADGMDETEKGITGRIRAIAISNEDAALQIIGLPFLDAIDLTDYDAVASLDSLVAYAEDDTLTIFDALIAKPWFADGLDETEQMVVSRVGAIVDAGEDTVLQLLNMPFLETIEPGDGAAVNALVVLRQNYSPPIFDAIFEKPWIADGLDENELEVVSKARSIADASEDTFFQILEMPFLDSIGTADRHAMEALHGMAHFSPDSLRRIIESPPISGGITDRAAKIMLVLPHFVNKDEPDWDLVDALLEPDNNLLEERTITLPLAGEVDLSIIRTTPGSGAQHGLSGTRRARQRRVHGRALSHRLRRRAVRLCASNGRWRRTLRHPYRGRAPARQRRRGIRHHLLPRTPRP